MSRSRPPASADTRHVRTVTELNQDLRRSLQAAFPSVWVVGEIGDLARPRSGHVYLTLKDHDAQLRSILWRSTAARLKFELEEGMEVVCEGQIDVYPARGTYQLIIRKVEPKGIGALQLAFHQLRERLENEGLFAAERKRPLPRFAKRVTVITSPTGAAVHDFLKVHRRRWSETEFLIIPTRVQGAEAAEEIVDAIQLAQQLHPPPEVIVLTRGGGSLEDLWCFNEESVVREVAAANIPIVSAVGHEIDITLCDLAADVRALTPSEAAERLSPSREDLIQLLNRTSRHVKHLLVRRLQWSRERVEQLANRPVLVDPTRMIRDLTRRVDDGEERLNQQIKARFQRLNQTIAQYAGTLEALSPLKVLQRGFSVTQASQTKSVLRSVQQVSVGDRIATRLADGHIHSQVVDIPSKLPDNRTPESHDYGHEKKK